MASEATDSKEKMATSLEANMLYMNKVIKADKKFRCDIPGHTGRWKKCLYLPD